MFELDDIQQQIAISARRHFERAAVEPATGGDGRQTWREIADLGWLAAAVPDHLGGVGGAVETAILAGEFALGTRGEPFLEAAVFPALFLAAMAGVDDRAASLFEQVVGGECIVSAVWEGPAGGGLTVVADGYRLRLTGRIDAVPGVDIADRLLVIAHHDDRAVALLVDVDTPGLSRVALPTIDGRTASALTFDVVFDPAQLFADADVAIALAQDAAILGQCAQLMAIVRRMMELTGEHLSTRQQFGQPLAAFQALRHRYADMFAESELGGAILQLGLESIGLDDARRSRAVSACKLRIGQAARFVSAQAIQLHGAMAITEEYELGRLYKRALILRKTWGDEDAHAARMIAIPAAT